MQSITLTLPQTHTGGGKKGRDLVMCILTPVSLFSVVFFLCSFLLSFSVSEGIKHTDGVTMKAMQSDNLEKFQYN